MDDLQKLVHQRVTGNAEAGLQKLCFEATVEASAAVAEIPSEVLLSAFKAASEVLCNTIEEELFGTRPEEEAAVTSLCRALAACNAPLWKAGVQLCEHSLQSELGGMTAWNQQMELTDGMVAEAEAACADGQAAVKIATWKAQLTSAARLKPFADAVRGAEMRVQLTANDLEAWAPMASRWITRTRSNRKLAVIADVASKDRAASHSAAACDLEAAHAAHTREKTAELAEAEEWAERARLKAATDTLASLERERDELICRAATQRASLDAGVAAVRQGVAIKEALRAATSVMATLCELEASSIIQAIELLRRRACVRRESLLVFEERAFAAGLASAMSRLAHSADIPADQVILAAKALENLNMAAEMPGMMPVPARRARVIALPRDDPDERTRSVLVPSLKSPRTPDLLGSGRSPCSQPSSRRAVAKAIRSIGFARSFIVRKKDAAATTEAAVAYMPMYNWDVSLGLGQSPKFVWSLDEDPRAATCSDNADHALSHSPPFRPRLASPQSVMWWMEEGPGPFGSGRLVSSSL